MRWKLADDTGGQGAFFADEELVERHVGTGEFRGLEFLHVNARTIINEIPKAALLPFTHTINVYRGCSHACSYCFARPTHDYLGLGIGEDFERKIVVKINAVERLRAELRSPKWAKTHIAMGTNTDPYQRCEGKYHLTQGVIKALAEARNPFSILTKSTLILRDLKLLQQAAEVTDVRCNFSIGTLDEAAWKASEPGTPHPRRRVEAVRKLNEAGIPCGVLVAPILPGLSDRPEQINDVVQACVEAGATSVTGIPLHLRKGVKDHYMGWLAEQRPDLVPEYERRYRGRSYLPVKDRQEIGSLVRGAVRRAGGTTPMPVSMPEMPEPSGLLAPEAPQLPESTQLDLAL